MDKTTFFTAAEPASPWKKLAAYFLDFLLALILMLGLFGIEEAIANNTSGYKENQTKITEIYQEMRDITKESQLSRRDSNGNSLSQNDIVKDFLLGATYESLLRNKDVSLSETRYQDVTPITEENDSCYYYYVTFKTGHKEDFTTSSLEKSGLEYYRKTLFSSTSEEYYEEGDYPYLTLDTAKAIDEYYRNATYTKGCQVYTSIYNAYLSLLKDGVNDIQANYLPFVRLEEQYQSVSKNIYAIKTIELIVAYIVSLLLYFLLLPILLKDGRTLAFRIMSLGVVNHREEKLSFYNHLIKVVMNLLEYVFMIAITALIFFGTSSLDLIGRNLFGDVSFLTIAVFSFLIMAIDYLFSFIFHKTHQTFTEFASMEIVKDGRMFHSVVTKELNQNGK